MVELLAPAGSFDSLRAAVNAGADAVYIGGKKFGARAYADNPETDVLLSGLDYCHIHGRKLYLTVNTLLKERELEEELYEYLLPYYQEGLDGVIVQDFGVMRLIRDVFPLLPVHASTQMTVTGVDSARLLKAEGVTRAVTARELSLEEVRCIIDKTGIEIETFIHGALCYSYSGQCLLSSMIGGRSGNRGRCAQPCRLPYQLKHADGTAPDGQKYYLSMKDLCTLDLLPELLDAGIASLKIEGRMKRPEYTAGVVSIYRKYLDRCLEYGIGTGTRSGKSFDSCRRRYTVEEEDRRILMDLYNRGGFTKGYYQEYSGRDMMSMERPNHFGTEAARIAAGKRGVRSVTAKEPLYKNDVLETHDGRPGFTLTQDVCAGAPVPLPKGWKLPVSECTLYRTRCEALLQRLQETYLERNCQEKIKGDFILSEGSPAILSLYYGDYEVTVCSEKMVTRAESRPLDAASVEKQLRKTGNTPFVFSELAVTIKGQLFFPLRELNELRRQGLEQLEQLVLASFRRELQGDGRRNNVAEKRQCQEEALSYEVQRQEPESGRRRLSVFVMTQEQLQAVLQVRPLALSAVYLDLLAVCTGRYRADAKRLEELLALVHEQGLLCYLNLPPVFRKGDRELLEETRMHQLLPSFDGFLLHTLDELAYLRAAGIRAELIADDTLYAYNRRAETFLREHGVGRLTFPAELNFRELQGLTGQERELVVYGHQALMHSAQCLIKNTTGCRNTPSKHWLKDRRKAEFPVLCRCTGCCNTIYNSVPLELISCQREIDALKPSVFRLSFTVESGAETEAVLARYGAWLDGAPASGETAAESTRGHFRRGVE